MRKQLAAAIAIGLLGAGTGMVPRASAKTDLLYLNYQKVLNEAPQIKASHQLLSRQIAPEIQHLKVLRKRLKEAVNKLKQIGPATNPFEKASLIENVKSARHKLRTEEQNYRLSLSMRARQLSASFANLIKRLASTDAANRGGAVVLRSGVLYAAPRVDITQIVLQQLRIAYKKAHKGGGSKP